MTFGRLSVDGQLSCWFCFRTFLVDLLLLSNAANALLSICLRCGPLFYWSMMVSLVILWFVWWLGLQTLALLELEDRCLMVLFCYAAIIEVRCKVAGLNGSL
ncbi:hypothetical protein Nepgr_024760 [Nepenthes gracilis]|uniref:Transmembrane protein n=1 Tax=Nepenthes gracilis TaxID=150966 RepID=A0AAD3XYX5_NEPGR|nr:hypothetical protein Nepgr_024760 [Nepenthes gracilis]